MSQSSSSPPPQLKSRIGAILRSTSGNFLEQFDFFLFGFYAPVISKAFFPSENETAALLNTFGVFWLGALMRDLICGVSELPGCDINASPQFRYGLLRKSVPPAPC